MLDNVGLRYPHRASGTKAPRTLRPLPLLRFAVSATGGAHLCSIQYYLRFWLSICRTSLAVSALRIMRYCPMFSRAGQGRYGGILIRPFNIIRHKCGKIKNNRWSKQVKCVELRKIMSMAAHWLHDTVNRRTLQSIHASGKYFMNPASIDFSYLISSLFVQKFTNKTSVFYATS